MRTLSRYILKEIAGPTLIGISVFTFIIFMRDTAKLLELVVRNSAPLPSIAEIFFLTIPAALTITVPMGVLVGALTGLSRLASDSEVTAMRASGIGVSLFVKVVGAGALFVAILAAVNNNLIAPRSFAAVHDLQEHLKTSQASFEVQPRVFYEGWKNYVLYVQDVTPSNGVAVWKGLFLADLANPNSPRITLAREGIAVKESETSVRLHLIDGAQHEIPAGRAERYSTSSFDETDIPINLQRTETERDTAPTPVNRLLTPELYAKGRAAGTEELRRWYMAEFHRRFAMAAACLIFALIAIPFGISSRKGGKASGYVFTFILVFLYYFASLAGSTLVKSTHIPTVVGDWLPNILFAFAAAFLLWRVDRMPLDLGNFRGLGARVGRALGRMLLSSKRARDVEERFTRRRLFNLDFPQILDEYILRDFALYLALITATFVFLFLIFTFFELLNDITRNHTPILTVMEYLFWLAPSVFYTLAPLAVLLAVLITFGLMQKNSEVTAIKATGVSIYRLAVPVLVIAAVVGLGLFALDQLYLPDANRRQEALRNEIKGRPAQTFSRPESKWIFGQQANELATIYYYQFFDPDQNRFGRLSVFEFDPRSMMMTHRVYGAEAHWQERTQKWVIEDGWERSFSNGYVANYRTFGASTFSELSELPTYFKKEVKQSSEMNYLELNSYIDDLQRSGFDVVRLKVQLRKKIAFPVIAFVMGVLAFPFALSAGKRGALTGVSIALTIAVVYWTTSSLFEAMGNVNQLPATLAAWAPDILFGLIGGYFIFKVPT